MKTYVKYLVAILITISALTEIRAQYGSGYGYGGRQRSAIPQAQTPQEQPKALTAEEIVDNEMPNITEVVSLNPFEEAIVRTTLTKYVQKRIELQILNLDPEKTREALDKITEEQDEELKSSLPDEKYEAFMQLQKDRFKTKKKKKKKNKD
tara:strand:- start:561 stop:1013 length:453 start_codon:yes stop_codon:yes gene_type:complete